MERETLRRGLEKAIVHIDTSRSSEAKACSSNGIEFRSARAAVSAAASSPRVASRSQQSSSSSDVAAARPANASDMSIPDAPITSFAAASSSTTRSERKCSSLAAASIRLTTTALKHAHAPSWSGSRCTNARKSSRKRGLASRLMSTHTAKCRTTSRQSAAIGGFRSANSVKIVYQASAIWGMHWSRMPSLMRAATCGWNVDTSLLTTSSCTVESTRKKRSTATSPLPSAPSNVGNNSGHRSG
eukprot:scaffold282160_cov31-Tisochrysis_lutea.AAC.1